MQNEVEFLQSLHTRSHRGDDKMQMQSPQKPGDM
jgi:hypothetical protein